MAHNVFGIKLSRDVNERQALLKGLAGALIRSEAIETTDSKAKAARDLIEKMITHARRATLNDIRLIESVLTDKDLVDKLVNTIAPRYVGRPGGYLRVIKLGNRAGDNAPMVRLEFVEGKAVAATPKPKAKATKKLSAPKAAKPVKAKKS